MAAAKQEFEEVCRDRCLVFKRILDDDTLSCLSKYRRICQFIEQEELTDLCMLLQSDDTAPTLGHAAGGGVVAMFVPPNGSEPAAAVAKSMPPTSRSSNAGSGLLEGSQTTIGLTEGSQTVIGLTEEQQAVIAENKARALAHRAAKQEADRQQRDLSIAENMQWL